MSKSTPGIIVILLASCQFGDPAPHYSYEIPRDLYDGLQVSSLENEGLDQQAITRLTGQIVRENYKRLHSLLILKNNKLVYENYFNGYQQHIPHNNYSVAKSYTSILTGIAIEKGIIDSLDVPILT